MNLLAISDVELPNIYRPEIAERFTHVDLAIGCGDLGYDYLEYIVSVLNIPMYFVRGNHNAPAEDRPEAIKANPDFLIANPQPKPWGVIDLHRRAVRDRQTGLLLAGIEGCIRYNAGPYQYTQAEMWAMVLRLAPRLVINRARYGRAIDIFVSHAPPYQVQDQPDLPHQGVKAFNWLIQTFRPKVHLHGHIHVYKSVNRVETWVGRTLVINAYGFREFSL